MPLGSIDHDHRAPDQLQAEHDRLYLQACAAVRPLIEIHGKPLTKLTPARETQLRQGIARFEDLLRINPENWAAMWYVGKAYHRLGEFERALQSFSRAHDINPSQPDVAREAAIAAMELGNPAAAIPFCQHAIQARPDDPGLRANLALALLFSGEVKRATDTAADALRRDPGDKITRRIHAVCKDVQAGQRPCPRHVKEIV
jgi:Flp pilus assembly protein TadD